jgi:hypothetical protein
MSDEEVKSVLVLVLVEARGETTRATMGVVAAEATTTYAYNRRKHNVSPLLTYLGNVLARGRT